MRAEEDAAVTPGLRVLHIEDNPDDAELIQARLAAEGMACAIARVETRDAFLTALEVGGFDLILADYALPNFDGLSAFALARERRPEVPFIFVSGMIGEEAAIEALKQGATDYVLKQRLSRLVPAVRRALRDTKDRAERQRMEEKLRLSDQVFESSAEGILVTDKEARILVVNPAFSLVTGYGPAEVLGQTPRLLRSGRHNADFYREMWASVLETGQWMGEIWNRRKDGEIYPGWLTISAVRNAQGEVTNYIGACSDLTEEKRTEERIYNLAHYDVVTGLPNRLLLEDRLRLTLVQAHRSGGRVALLFLDLDRFKDVNDSLGHPVGDRLLQAVAQRLGDCLREGDTAARWGGDEFVVLLQDLSGEQRAVAQRASVVAEKIQQALSGAFTIDGHEVPVTPSTGIALYPWDADNATDLIKYADTAMYQAKAQGRNNFQFYAAPMHKAVTARLFLENELRRALQRCELSLHYQPQVDIASGRITGAEALLRWRHPVRGDIAPAEFIPLAEETGQILTIGEWVLDTAWAQCCAWQAADLRLPRLSVNVSPRQFQQTDFIRRVQALVEMAEPNGWDLELEVTEGTLMQCSEGVRAALDALKARGFKLAVDDFGIGYASLDSLRRFPINELKIDQSFVRDITSDPYDAAIVRAIIAMAQGLDLRIVAEGVETQAQLACLQQLGCSEYQGYLFSRPLPAEAFGRLLRYERL